MHINLVDSRLDFVIGSKTYRWALNSKGKEFNRKEKLFYDLSNKKSKALLKCYASYFRNRINICDSYTCEIPKHFNSKFYLHSYKLYYNISSKIKNFGTSNNKVVIINYHTICLNQNQLNQF